MARSVVQEKKRFQQRDINNHNKKSPYGGHEMNMIHDLTKKRQEATAFRATLCPDYGYCVVCTYVDFQSRPLFFFMHAGRPRMCDMK